jgi:predicted outer membrane lipoprotein
VGGGTVKILLNLLNLGTFVLFCFAVVTGIHLERDISGLGSHLAWVLGTLLLWMFTTILSMMYMYRMEKFCVEIVEKFEGKGSEGAAKNS